MKKLNLAASEAVLATDLCAVTDVTGYGLLGHLCQMMSASGKSSLIHYSQVPLLPGALEMAKADQFPGGSHSNLLSVGPDIERAGNFEKYEMLILADAQTSGGLLISISSMMADKLEMEMRKRDVFFVKIGEVKDKAKWLVRIARN
jgi:selenide,water dikinase